MTDIAKMMTIFVMDILAVLAWKLYGKKLMICVRLDISGQSLIDGSAGGRWFYAVGVWTPFSYGFPGPGKVVQFVQLEVYTVFKKKTDTGKKLIH